MKNNNIIRFAQSLVLLPLATTMLSSGVPTEKAPSVLSKVNIETLSALSRNQDKDLKEVKQAKARAIDDYFAKYEMPLQGTGLVMVSEAEKNGLDWRLLPAIAVRESTGGKYKCKRVEYNPFGWGSCKIGFESYDHAIATIARNLGGNNPNTAYHYDDKTTREILHAYNPPSIVPRYADQVINIMNNIGPENVEVAENSKENKLN